MQLEPTGRLGDPGTRGRPETRVSRESLVPLERRERLVTRGMQDRTDPLESGVALEKEDLGGPQAYAGREETQVKLDPKETKGEKAPWASLETRARLAPSDLKDTGVTRARQDPRVSEEPQDPPVPLETQG